MTTTAVTTPHPIYLAGRWVESPELLVVDDPAHPERPAGATYNATPEQYEEAVTAAVAAFEKTRRLPAFERSAALRQISAGIAARREEIGRLIALESGKPIRDALGEVDRAVLTFRFGAEEAERIGGEVIPLDLNPASRGRTGITRRFPIGPIAAISPFNFPLNLAAHKLAPAIASGNPIVLKPPSKDPLTMLTVAEIVAEAGLPEGAVSILPMTRELGDRMVSDERFKLLTFTGSPSVGWKMKARAGKKRVVLELGGNAGVIVDRTADIDWAVRRTLVGAFSYAGQVCISVQRMFVHEAIWDEFMGRFVEGAAQAQGGRSARPADGRRADGRREGRSPGRGPGWTKPARWAAESSPAARPTGRTSHPPSLWIRLSKPGSAATRPSRRSWSPSGSPTSATPSAASTTPLSACRRASSPTTWPTPGPPSRSSRSAASSSTTCRPTASTTCPTAAPRIPGRAAKASATPSRT